MSLAVPGHLIIKYHNAGSIQSFPLETEDFPSIWKKNWTDNLRIEMEGRFLWTPLVCSRLRIRTSPLLENLLLSLFSDIEDINFNVFCTPKGGN